MFKLFRKPTQEEKDNETSTTFVAGLREKLSENYEYDEYDADDADISCRADTTGIFVTEHNRIADMTEEDQGVIMNLKDTHTIHVNRNAETKGRQSRTEDGKAFETVRVRALSLVEE